jgi:transposase
MSVDAKIQWMHAEETLIVGVDMAKKVPWAQLINLKGLSIGKAFPFENNRYGFRRLVQTFQEVKQQTGATRIVVGIESTGHYWKPLARFVVAEGITVVLVNPYHVKRTKETEDNTPTKSDRKDARLIAKMTLDGKFLTCMLPVGPYADLRWLSQARLDKVSHLNAAINKLHAVLDQFFPEFPGLFSNLTGKTPILLLAICPLPTDVLKYTEAELFDVLKQRGLRAKKQTLYRLRQAADESIGITEGQLSGRLVLESLLAEIHFWQGEKEKLEQAMAMALTATGVGSFLVSIPGVGPITAAIFLSEIGDLSQYQDWRQLRRMAGLNLVENSSGERYGQKRISKRGRPYLRATLYHICRTMLKCNREFQAIYAHFRTRKHNQLTGKEAVVALISKLLRVMFTLVTKRTYYDSALVIGPVREQQIATAA